MNDYLSPLLNKSESLPFLFIGSGFSRRYLGLPNWEGLLEYIASITYEDSFGFISAKNQTGKLFNKEKQYNQYMTTLCDIISNDLDKIWYKDKRFKDTREKYKEQISEQNIPPIKIEIAEYLTELKEKDLKLQPEIEALKSISTHSISGIITTNYDDLLEDLFEYTTYTSQEELLFHSMYEIGEIYKIHGCVRNPGSIKINTQDYKSIEEKHKYISAKLLTIFLEHPIFFIGYSLGDQDILSILEDIQSCLNSEQLKRIEERMFYVVWDENVEEYEESTYSITFEGGRTLTMKKITLSDYSVLYDVLATIKSKYPVKMLRNVKEDMYKLILTDDPDQRMVLSLPSEELSPDKLKEIEFVYGFGIIERARDGYRTVNRDEIYEDIVFDNKNFVPEMLVQDALPTALATSGYVLPLWKYVSQVDHSIVPTLVDNAMNRVNTIRKILPQTINYKKQSAWENMTFESALEGMDPIKRLAAVNYTVENIDQLGEFLRSETMTSGTFKTDTDLRRLIRVFDYFKYK